MKRMIVLAAAVLSWSQPSVAAGWSVGVSGDLTLLGQTLRGAMEPGTCAGVSGQVFKPTAGRQVPSLNLAGYDITLSDLCLLYTPPGAGTSLSGGALGGTATLTVPSGSPLRTLIGNAPLVVGVSGSPSKISLTLNQSFTLVLAEDGRPLRVRVDLSKLTLAYQSVTATNPTASIAVSGEGTMTVGDASQSFALQLGSDQSLTVTVKGVNANLNLLGFLSGQINGDVSLALGRFGTAPGYPFNHLMIKQVGAQAGTTGLNLGVSANNLDYYLPSTVPPLGLPFGDMAASVDVAGIGVEIDMTLDKPGTTELLEALRVIASAVATTNKAASELSISDIPSGNPLAKVLFGISKGEVAGVEQAVQAAGSLEKPSLTLRSLKLTIPSSLSDLLGSEINLLPQSVTLTPRDLARLKSGTGLFDILAERGPRSLPTDMLSRFKSISQDLFTYDLKANIKQGNQQYAPTTISGLKGRHFFMKRLYAKSVAPLPTEGVTEIPINYSDDLSVIQSVLDLAKLEGNDWTGHLAQIVQRLKDNGYTLRANGKAIQFDNGRWPARLELLEYDGRLDISGIKGPDNDGTWSARFGKVTLFGARNFEGHFRELDGNWLNDAESWVDSVKIEGRGKAQITDRSGRTATLSLSTKDLAKTQVRPNSELDIRLFWPINLARVSSWRLSMNTQNGLDVTVDNGGVSIALPKKSGGSGSESYRLLYLMPNSRIAKASAETRKILDKHFDRTLLKRMVSDASSELESGHAMRDQYRLLVNDAGRGVETLPARPEYAGTEYWMPRTACVLGLQLSQMGSMWTWRLERDAEGKAITLPERHFLGPLKVQSQWPDRSADHPPGSQFFKARGLGEEELWANIDTYNGIAAATQWALSLSAPGAVREQRYVRPDDEWPGAWKADWFAIDRWRIPVTVTVSRNLRERAGTTDASVRLTEAYTEVRGELGGSKNSLLVNLDNPNNPPRIDVLDATGWVYPESGWRLYAEGKPIDLDRLTAVQDKVKLAYRMIDVGQWTCNIDGLGRVKASCGGLDPDPEGLLAAQSDLAGYHFELPHLNRFGKVTLANQTNPLLLAYDSGLATGIRTPVGQEEGGLAISGLIKGGVPGMLDGNLTARGLLNTQHPSIDLDGTLTLFGNTTLSGITGNLDTNRLSLKGTLALPAGLGRGAVQGVCSFDTPPNLSLNGQVSIGDKSTLGITGALRMDTKLALGRSPDIAIRGDAWVMNQKLYSGDFEYRDNALSFEYSREVDLKVEGLDVSAGIDGRVTLKMDNTKLGGTFDGTASVGLEWPIKLWYCAGIDCGWYGCWPSDCGWHTVHTVSLHQRLGLGMMTIDSTGKFSKGFDFLQVSPTLKVNLGNPSSPFSVSW